MLVAKLYTHGQIMHEYPMMIASLLRVEKFGIHKLIAIMLSSEINIYSLNIIRG